ncbi:MAG: hypothetical protein JEY94_15225 [Melioribacteraceae bacterium]|nr:hypothetical protein [Melioribacteraceae bacterium]
MMDKEYVKIWKDVRDESLFGTEYHNFLKTMMCARKTHLFTRKKVSDMLKYNCHMDGYNLNEEGKKYWNNPHIAWWSVNEAVEWFNRDESKDIEL